MTKIAKLNRTNIKTDSRKVMPGDIFFAVKGTVFDGHDHIQEALGKGASAVYCERIPEEIPKEAREKFIVSGDTKHAIALAAKDVFGDPSSMFRVHGVTGTNGKTTCVFLIDAISDALGSASGFVSTVFTKQTGTELKRSTLTTPDVLTLNRMFAKMVADGKRSVALEISSHALSQGRISGIALDSAVFTNITPEHLDYHKNMQTYLYEKTRIFENLKPRGAAILNADDPLVISTSAKIKASKLISFGIKEKANVRAENLRFFSGRTEFDIKTEGAGTVAIKTGLVGAFNVYNILAAVSVFFASGMDLDAIKKGVEEFSAPPGRLDPVESNAPFKVFIDYAHTPDALKSVLSALRRLVRGKLICVFGCGGDRDKSKRPVMGRIAGEFSDVVIITNDNPRGECAKSILSDIEKGMVGKTNYSIIESRRCAIHEAVSSAGERDIVLIAGKGHENYQIMQNEILPFDDKKVAKEALEEKGYF
ncbi:MAG: UDP-N-acetylmuramoyl-L-alanyl-D-glutamate--2,6-diaminopimelate ligase [Candidatus Omnitrophica bacterium]|nr:UDP-N-acetylmuramoyl-L-alanyl-D-glutamate--2,6-diaminopimelate ligase [Candidatus Omnitrophota bacterium]